jgi:uncharacterized lipoprotein YmbA
VLLLPGCVTHHSDHFYALAAQPAGVRESRVGFSKQVALRVTLPSLVDRGEIVVASKQGILVLEHERWAAPLADQILTTLGQDIEQRRSDVMVLARGAEARGTEARGTDQAGVTTLRIFVDIIQLTVHLEGQVSVESHWRIVDAASGKQSLGRDVFVSPVGGGNYQGVAQAVSACVGLLADRLVTQFPAD